MRNSFIILSDEFDLDYYQSSLSNEQIPSGGLPLENGYIGIEENSINTDDYGYNGDSRDYSDYLQQDKDKFSYIYTSFYDDWVPCDQEVKLVNGTHLYFSWQNLNDTRCKCQYSDYKTDLLYSYACAKVSSGGKGFGGHILTVPSPWDQFSCDLREIIYAAHSKQVFHIIFLNPPQSL